jgi:hypothetical protein
MVTGFSLFTLVYLVFSALLSLALVAFLTRKVPFFRKETFVRHRFEMTLITGVIIFALSIMVASAFSRQNFFAMASKLLVEFAWMLAAILVSLVIRLEGDAVRKGIRLYLPILLLSLIVISLRIAFIPNSLLATLRQQLVEQLEAALKGGQQGAKQVTKSYFESALGVCSYTGPVDADGKPDGTGEASFTDKRLYRGPFVHGNFEGDNAFFRYENGDVFEGTFNNNQFAKGKYTLKADGSYFVGSFSNGQPAVGQWYDKNGNKI